MTRSSSTSFDIPSFFFALFASIEGTGPRMGYLFIIRPLTLLICVANPNM